MCKSTWQIYRILILILATITISTAYFTYMKTKKGAMISSGEQNTYNNTQHKQDDPASGRSIIPIASNQWYSSVYKEFPSQPIYALPLVYKLSPAGISFSYPKIQKTPQTIFASYNEDFTVSGSKLYDKPQITALGDWDVHFKMRSADGKQITFFLAHGIPYTIIRSDNESLSLSFKESAQVLPIPDLPDNAFAVTTKQNTYIFVLKKKFIPNIVNQKLSLGSQRELFVGLLDEPKNAVTFIQQAENDIITTIATPKISDDKLSIVYQLVTANGPAITILYPHQYENLLTPVTSIGKYQSIRGELKLTKLQTFTTSIPLITPQVNFAPLNQKHTDLIDQLTNDVNAFTKQAPPDSKDYFLGTWFGKGVTLIQLADTLGEDSLKTKLVNYLTPVFVRSLNDFEYNAVTTSLVAKFPEFGNEKNNDHHFHYGYYIRAAAILASYNPSLLSKFRPVVSQMVEDIATTDKNSSKYPYLRNFDAFESHSWADGFALFNDGNNEESSSEAINAWYSLYLWSQVTQNKTIENTALSLYNSEIQGAIYYWFGKNQMYTKPYDHAIASIVWGGKVDYATWFSPETNMKYGIQLLPFTPGSMYLANLDKFEKFNNDFHASGGNEKKDWGDLFLVWKSFYQPTEALKFIQDPLKPESNTPRSLFLYYLYKNNNQ